MHSRGKNLIISTIQFMTCGTGTSTICSKILPDSRSVDVTLITSRLCSWLKQSDPRFVDGCAHEAQTESHPRCLSKSVTPPPRRFAPRLAVTERRYCYCFVTSTISSSIRSKTLTCICGSSTFATSLRKSARRAPFLADPRQAEASLLARQTCALAHSFHHLLHSQQQKHKMPAHHD